MAAAISTSEEYACLLLVPYSSFVPEIKWIFLGCFDLVNIIVHSPKKSFPGWPNQYFSWNKNSCTVWGLNIQTVGFLSVFGSKVQNTSMQNDDNHPVLTRTRQFYLLFRIEHRTSYGDSTQLRILESVWMFRDHVWYPITIHLCKSLLDSDIYLQMLFLLDDDFCTWLVKGHAPARYSGSQVLWHHNETSMFIETFWCCEPYLLVMKINKFQADLTWCTD